MERNNAENNQFMPRKQQIHTNPIKTKRKQKRPIEIKIMVHVSIYNQAEARKMCIKTILDLL